MRKNRTGAEARARQLHDRSTRGETLTSSEQAELAAWYAQQDEEESNQLEVNATPSVETLQAQADAALTRLLMVTQHIEALTRENEAARHEIADLVRQRNP